MKEKKLDDEFATDLTIMEKPQVPLSDQIVRSPTNDMIANIPLNWFFVDTEEKAPSNIFSVSCNYEYSMCALFFQLTQTQFLNKLAASEGLVGIAKYCFEQKSKKSLGNIELIGDFIPLKNGKQKFYIFTFKNKIDNTIGKSAVFISSLNNFYEFSLLQLSFKTNKLNKAEFDKTFQSILASIKF
ncbi:MAG: hypothetical protein ACUVQ1_04535 [Candidatus Kapaibacteriales bacterium]